MIRFWRPEAPAWVVAVVYVGAFDGWYRGAVHAHVAGSVKLEEPGHYARSLS